jgi:hypothetical protein
MVHQRLDSGQIDAALHTDRAAQAIAFNELAAAI